MEENKFDLIKRKALEYFGKADDYLNDVVLAKIEKSYLVYGGLVLSFLMYLL